MAIVLTPDAFVARIVINNGWSLVVERDHREFRIITLEPGGGPRGFIRGPLRALGELLAALSIAAGDEQ